MSEYVLYLNPRINPLKRTLMSNSKYNPEDKAVGVDGSLKLRCQSIWSHEFLNVSLPLQVIFDHIPYRRASIMQWLRDSKAGKPIGGLMSPDFSEMVKSNLLSKEVCLKIEYVSELPSNDSKAEAIKANVKISIFGRVFGEMSDIHPFDGSHWPRECYNEWNKNYRVNATVLRYTCDEFTAENKKLFHVFPKDVCTFFRTMMRAHYTDCVTIYGKFWPGLCLGEMTRHSMSAFMSDMLIGMFMGYHSKSELETPTANAPAFFDVVLLNCDNRVCSKCKKLKLKGHGELKRCECKEVYYCSSTCQKEDWEWHSLVCPIAKSRAARKAAAKATGRTEGTCDLSSTPPIVSPATSFSSPIDKAAWLSAHFDMEHDPSWFRDVSAIAAEIAASVDTLEAEMEATIASFHSNLA
jgi:hypothetical protein